MNEKSICATVRKKKRQDRHELHAQTSEKRGTAKDKISYGTGGAVYPRNEAQSMMIQYSILKNQIFVFFNLPRLYRGRCG